MKKSILIHEIPKLPKYNVYGSKNIKDFFRDYEKYCKTMFLENKSYWVKELGESLE